MTKKTPRIIIIVQARMGSTRLPGKILKEVLQKPLLSYEIERLKQVKNAQEVIIATTTNQLDQAVIDLCQKEGMGVFRGSEEDVLGRYYEAAVLTKADVIVRITADCPLIDPRIIDKAIALFLDTKSDYDYLSNAQERTYPRGMDVEVFSRKALEKAYDEAHLPEEREHVTLYLYRHPEKFHIGSFKRNLDASSYRLTVDTAEDFALIKIVLEQLYPQNPHFSLEEILKLLENHPEWYALNRHVQQKGVIK